MHHVPQQSSPAGGVPTQREKERIGQLGDWAAVPGEFPSPLSSRGSYSPPRERLGLRRRVRYSKNPNATTPSKMPAVCGADTTRGTRDTGQNPTQDEMKLKGSWSMAYQ
eukprot:m.1177337 g.1177337  ORF g.1177337 m.1177337 type:complete len:109 (-) comp24524_c0_seq3:2369-2695(-)